jgi:hypothetical protein
VAGLLPITKRLLRETQQPFSEIAKGAGVKLRWLHMLANNEIPNPGVVGVQKVHDYLAARSNGAGNDNAAHA